MDREEMILSNLNIVHAVLKKIYYPPGAYYDYEDLYQEGVCWLINAVDRYNPDLGFAFSTYAYPYVKGGILRFISENYNLHYSRKERMAVYRISKDDKEADPNDVLRIAVATEKDKEIVNAMKSYSLDFNIMGKDGSETPIGDLIEDPKAEKSFDFVGIEDDLERIKDKILIKKGIAFKEVAEEWYYSTIFGYKITQTEIARKVGISQAQVSRALRLFKEKFYKALQENGYEIKFESYEV